MGIVGIVAEYNPFHNGHAYQMEQARIITGCDSLIVAMSGDFVQRGTPAVMDKELRTIAALQSGADMVLQIPTPYSTASAEAFAYGSVSLLVSAGIDTLVFGCEDLSLDLLETLADFYVNEPETYKERLLTYLKEGLSFPLARSRATAECLPHKEVEDILKKPNNILAIEYIKALKRLEKEGRLIKPVSLCPILRIGTGYHSLETAEHICSATALRAKLYEDCSGGWEEFVPSNMSSQMLSYFQENKPITEDDYSNELRYCLTSGKKVGFSHYSEGNEDLSNRLINRLGEYESYSDFCKNLQTKEVTYARISRFLLHILLNITEEKMQFLKSDPVPYIRVLGIKKDRKDLLSCISKQATAPLLVNVKNSTELLNANAQMLLDIDVFARELYLTKIKGKTDFQFPIM